MSILFTFFKHDFKNIYESAGGYMYVTESLNFRRRESLESQFSRTGDSQQRNLAATVIQKNIRSFLIGHRVQQHMAFPGHAQQNLEQIYVLNDRNTPIVRTERVVQNPRADEINVYPIIRGVVDPEENEKEDIIRHLKAKCGADLYFRPKAWERNTLIYKKLGVHLFKRALMATAGQLLRCLRNSRSNYYIGQGDNRNFKGLIDFDHKTRINEALHIIFGASNVYHLISSFKGSKRIPILDLSALVLHLILCAVQRYNRARIYNTLENMVGTLRHENNENLSMVELQEIDALIPVDQFDNVPIQLDRV